MAMKKNIELAIKALQSGKMVIVADSEDRENEGDLICASIHATPKNINFMIKEARGLICVPMTGERLDQLGLTSMTRKNMDPHGTAFTISVDAIEGITTGISSFERSKTIMQLIDPLKGPNDFRQPGHIFPLRARKGGVLSRAGHTEAAVDLCELAGLPKAGVICEILEEDGTMMRMPSLIKFSKKHDLPLITIADLISYLLKERPNIFLKTEMKIPNEKNSRILIFQSKNSTENHFAFVKGSISKEKETLVRVHSEKDSGKGSQKRLNSALEQIYKSQRGILVLLGSKEQEKKESKEMDFRSYGIGAQILKACGVGKMKIITNNERNIIALEGFGLEIGSTEKIKE
tara:strand:- start:1907 stop:2947 length:1041 start_codon:yes stop_codon:yes gene_type:complete